jgi:hypothetical protein
MRKWSILVVLAGVWMSGLLDVADAQSLPNTCPPRPTKVVTGPNGKTLTVCLDGKYSTCLRDAQRLGWASGEAKKYCDSRPFGERGRNL